MVSCWILWYSDSTVNAFFFKFLRWEKVSKNIWYCMAGKVENKKLEEYENENYHLLWWSDKRHFPNNCLGLSDEDNSVSRTDDFVNVNVLNSVASPHVLSYRKSKLRKKRRINIWNYRSPYLQFRPSWNKFSFSYSSNCLLSTFPAMQYQILFSLFNTFPHFRNFKKVRSPWSHCTTRTATCFVCSIKLSPVGRG